MPPIELILYLEPSKEFKDKVQDFLERCKEKFGPTTANKYSCHVTMTGFFNVENEQQQHNITRILEQLSSQFQGTPEVTLRSLLVRDQEHRPVHLLLPVTVPNQYHTMLSRFADQCSSIVSLRLKKMNHISLAYWDEPEATAGQQKIWENAVHNNIFEQIQDFGDNYFSNISAPVGWNIVFYKRTFKGKLVGESHEFEKLGQWTVQ